MKRRSLISVGALVAVVFLLGSLIGGVLYSLVTVQLLNRFDPKWAGARQVALELDVLGASLLSILGALLVLVVFVSFNTSKAAAYSRRRLLFFFAGSGLYVAVIDLARLAVSGTFSNSDAATIAGWGVVAIYPAALAFSATRLRTDCTDDYTEISE